MLSVTVDRSGEMIMNLSVEVKLLSERLSALYTSLSIGSKKLDRLVISCSTYIMKIEYVQVVM